jgi:hypothetical protein
MLDNSFENEWGNPIPYALVRKANGPKPYTMSLVGTAVKAVQMAVNIGIDSHLEACFIPERGDSYEYRTQKIGGLIVAPRLECSVSSESLPVLIRRLFEITGEFENEARTLASDILSTIGIQESGALEKERDDEV